jgi:hypothetical protein
MPPAEPGQPAQAEAVAPPTRKRPSTAGIGRAPGSRRAIKECNDARSAAAGGARATAAPPALTAAELAAAVARWEPGALEELSGRVSAAFGVPDAPQRVRLPGSRAAANAAAAAAHAAAAAAREPRPARTAAGGHTRLTAPLPCMARLTLRTRSFAAPLRLTYPADAVEQRDLAAERERSRRSQQDRVTADFPGLSPEAAKRAWRAVHATAQRTRDAAQAGPGLRGRPRGVHSAAANAAEAAAAAADADEVAGEAAEAEDALEAMIRRGFVE